MGFTALLVLDSFFALRKGTGASRLIVSICRCITFVCDVFWQTGVPPPKRRDWKIVVPPFPILLSKEQVNCGIREPAELFAHYINTLLGGGIPASDLPSAFLELYALDFYSGQVRNGGHSQFVGNSGGRLDANLDHAIRAALMLGLPRLVQLLGECRNWCVAHPIERDRQDGTSNRAVALNELDDRFFDMEYDDAGYGAFVASQSEPVQAWIRAATEATDFYARSEYHLAVGAWLLDQPDTLLLTDDELETAVERMLKLFARMT